MRGRRFLSCAAIVLALLAASGCVEEEPCAIGDERCDGDTVQYCLGPIDDGSWVNDSVCTGGARCTTQGCTGGHTACCVTAP